MCNTCGCKSAETFEGEKGYSSNCIQCGRFTTNDCDYCSAFLCEDCELSGDYVAILSNDRAYVSEMRDEIKRIGDSFCKNCVSEMEEHYEDSSYEAENFEGKVRTMSGKPHTPRKLRKDQNIKPEEARMRKKMEAQSKGKSKCSKHYWDLAVRRNPISGERQFFNQCLLCGKKNFSRGGSAMSDRGFFAEDLKMESYCGRCDKRTEISKIPWGATFCVCGRGKSIIVDGYELGSANETPQHLKDFLRSRGMRDYGAESYQVREGFDTCETCGDSPLFVSTQIAGGTYCMDCANRVWRAESPFSSDAFNEGRSAGITMFIPEGDAEDYYSNLDTEYMIFYGLSPEDLAKDIDGNSKRYLQFVAGWDDGWNYATLLHEGVLTDDSDGEGDLEDLDYEMAGEWIYQDFPKGLREYVPSPKEIGAEVAVLGGIVALGLGYFAFKGKI
jgi:hypothetical protein